MNIDHHRRYNTLTSVNFASVNTYYDRPEKVILCNRWIGFQCTTWMARIRHLKVSNSLILTVDFQQWVKSWDTVGIVIKLTAFVHRDVTFCPAFSAMHFGIVSVKNIAMPLSCSIPRTAKSRTVRDSREEVWVIWLYIMPCSSHLLSYSRQLNPSPATIWLDFYVIFVLRIWYFCEWIYFVHIVTKWNIKKGI